MGATRREETNGDGRSEIQDNGGSQEGRPHEEGREDGCDDPEDGQVRSTGGEAERPRKTSKTHEKGTAAGVRGVPDVVGPTKAEREEHERTHMPYKDWCKCCAMGRAREDKHSRKERQEGEEQVPTITLDYCFMGKEERKPATILVMKQ